MSVSLQTLASSARFDHFSIIQISDLHLADAYSDTPLLDKVLQDLGNSTVPIELIVVTGDLVQSIDTAIYEKIFTKLDKLTIPYVCIAGNHDVTEELDSHLPFEQRQHVAMPPHPRLRDKYTVMTPHWQLLFCDSTVSGQIHGNFSNETLAWLANQLATAKKPCVLFCHHHVLPVHSAWIDAHITQNYATFWQVIKPYSQTLSAIFTGHIHQEQNQVYQGVAVYTVPSLSVQFLPFSDDFALDTEAKAGYRWITLYNNAKLATGVKRMDTTSPNY